MKNRILTYRKYIDSLLQSEEDCDWKYIKQEHLTQVAFFQHERLVHLIVTITFAILELLTVCAYVIVGAIDSALSLCLSLQLQYLSFLFHTSSITICLKTRCRKCISSMTGYVKRNGNYDSCC